MAVNQKLLFISWMIPPAPGGSSYISHHLAKHFNEDEIIVVGGSRIPFVGSKIYDGVQYHCFFTELNWRGHGDRYFSIFRWILFPFFLFNLFLLIKKEKPNAILVTFPDGYYLLASSFIARFYNIKLFSYFHNTYAENRSGFSKWIAAKIQNRIFRDSKIIYLISEGILNYYKNTYPDFKSKFKVLPHTFDQYPIRDHSLKRIEGKPPYRLVMIGTFNQSNMEATIRLLKLIAKYPSKYQVDIFTSSNKQLLKFKFGLDLDMLGIQYMGFVKQENFEQLISNYDACLLTHGFTGEYSEIEYKTIFPTRMIPLLLTGNPILVHSPENSFLNEFVKKYDCAELVSEKSDELLLAALEKVTTDKIRIHQLAENAKVASSYFYGKEVIEILKKGLWE